LLLISCAIRFLCLHSYRKAEAKTVPKLSKAELIAV
jgi:hypothetical protein